MTKVAIKRALVSVYDKSGLADLAAALAGAGVEIVSTGSTAAAITAAGIPVTPVERVTGFPECLDGRVKTLHPGVHAGLLADTGRADHTEQLAGLGIAPFELLVSSLYPFESTVASGAAPAECVEQIDIGGPAMVRAAAKNHAAVAVVTSPEQYSQVTAALADGGFTLRQRQRLAAQAYAHTARYDAAVASWFASAYAPDDTAAETGWPDVVAALWTRREVLRYGENPHQRAAFYVRAGIEDGASGAANIRSDVGRTSSATGDSASVTEDGASAAGGGASGTGGGASAPADGAAVAGEGVAGAGGKGQGAAGRPSGARQRDTGRSAGPAGVAAAVQLHGKPMSYNNYVDAASALRAVRDFLQPCVAIMKHSNPCGIAVGPDLAQAHAKAHACDPVSAYGGVIAANGVVTAAMAGQVAEIFTEVIIAEGYEQAALVLLTRKKNLRVLTLGAEPGAVPGAGAPAALTAGAHTPGAGGSAAAGGGAPAAPSAGSPAVPGGGTWGRAAEWRQADGGLLLQSPDLLDQPGDDAAAWELKAGPPAGPDVLADLVFAWRACRSVKSNAILLASGGATVGVGMGQVNRVDSARLAVARAADRAGGSVAASDAFFPFPDGLEVLTKAGVRAIVEPGGSIRDDEVIAAAQAAGVSLYFTGVRHFFH